MVKELLCFDWCGKMAHFRKFYSTASAFTHTLPPRTTTLGLIAAIIGMEKDTYYEVLDKLLIGTQIIAPSRKIFQKFNYLKIASDSINLYAGIAPNRTQTSVELIVPPNIRKEDIGFRIYVGIKEEGNVHFEKLKSFLQANYHIYGISLGSANLLGYLKNAQTDIKFTAITDTEAAILLHTSALVEQITLGNNANTTIEQDNVPLKMQMNAPGSIKNKTRMALKVASIVYPLDGKAMQITPKDATNMLSVNLYNNAINVALL